MFNSVKENLKYCGRNVEIHPLTKIVKPEMIEIGDYAKIDDFTFINGGAGIRIGRYFYFAYFASITGGGELIIGDYVTIGYGSKIITASDTCWGDKMASSTLSKKRGTGTMGRIVIGNRVFIGNDVVIHPNEWIGEGAVICDHSQVVKDVKPWGIVVTQ